jgi:hypothetical protein
MTDINHRRSNRKPVNQRHTGYYDNGYGVHDGVRGQIQRVGNTDYLDKSMHGWGKVDKFSDKHIGASIGNDFSNGHRGMAKAVKGAKKFVRSRTRFHGNAETKRIANDYMGEFND